MYGPEVNELRRLLQAGAISPDIVPENVLAQILQPEPQMPQPRFDIADVPMNSMRTETGPDAGRTIDLNFQGQPQAQPQRMKLAGYGNGIMSDLGETEGSAPQLDYSRPAVDTPRGRGQYGKDGAIYVKGPDGSMTKILQGYDRDASFLQSKRNFELRRAESDLRKDDANIAQSQAATEHTQETTNALRAQRDVREDQSSQTFLDKRFGKPEAGMRWRPDGTLEPIPGGQKNADADSVLDLLKMAEPLLDKSTGSYLGAGMDQAARVFGAATSGANAASQLKALEGALISKMPKMSGPQSDKDVLLYKQMAGQLGDSTLPAEQKRAAMETIRQINSRYATPTGPLGAEVSAPPSAIQYLKANPQMRNAFDMKYGPGSAARVLGR